MLVFGRHFQFTKTCDIFIVVDAKICCEVTGTENNTRKKQEKGQ